MRARTATTARPTPLLLRYAEGDFNALHQDVYGEHVFPLQTMILLSDPRRDFTGGEFVLTEQRPRMQSRAAVIPAGLGDAVVWAVRERPARGSRGVYRVTMRHGVSRIRSGHRSTLGVISTTRSKLGAMAIAHGDDAGRAAFEIGRPAQRLLVLSEAQVAALVDPHDLLRELAASFGALDRGEVQCPPRPQVSVPERGFSLAMAAWQPGRQICVKVVNVFDGNLALGLPNHLAIINLFDPDTGASTCVMEATFITAVRTAAAAALSHRLLSRPASRVATIVGAGVQAREHLRLLPLVRDLDEIQICALDIAHAERLARLHPRARAAADAESAIRRSDVVCLATHSPTPVIDAAWIAPGTHVSSVGYHPPLGELPVALARTGRVFVETLDAFAPPPVGCAELAGGDRSAATTLGRVVNDRRCGRTNDTEITVYKAMGIAMEDMVAANLVYERARQSGAGTVADW